MRRTEVWDKFTPDEQEVIRVALHQPAAERTRAANALLRTLWRLHKRRSRDRLPAVDNHRINPEYRAWLKKKKLPLKFSHETYAQFRRQQ